MPSVSTLSPAGVAEGADIFTGEAVVEHVVASGTTVSSPHVFTMRRRTW